jgi:hypothetical protein
VYEVYLERVAERDLRRLPAETFHRIALEFVLWRRTRGRQAVASSPARTMIGGFGSEIIESSTRLTRAKKPLGYFGSDIAAKHIGRPLMSARSSSPSSLDLTHLSCEAVTQNQ